MSLYHRKNEVLTVKRVSGQGLVYQKYMRTGHGLVKVISKRHHGKKKYIKQHTHRYHSAPVKRSSRGGNLGADIGSAVRNDIQNAQLNMLDKQLAEKDNRDAFNTSISSRLNSLQRGGRTGGVQHANIARLISNSLR